MLTIVYSGGGNELNLNLELGKMSGLGCPMKLSQVAC